MIDLDKVTLRDYFVQLGTYAGTVGCRPSVILCLHVLVPVLPSSPWLSVRLF